MSTLYKVSLDGGSYGLVRAIDGDDASEYIEKRVRRFVSDVERATDQDVRNFEAMGGNHIYTTREARQEDKDES